MTAPTRRRPPRAPARDEDEVRLFVERLGSALTDAGMSRLPARAFAAMLADEDGRMTSTELAEALDISPASVSAAVRYLSQVLFLHREREPGTRRDVYVVREDAWHDAIVNLRRTYAPIQAAIASGIGAVGGVGTQAGERLSTSADFLEFIADEMTAIADRWEQRRRTLSRA